VTLEFDSVMRDGQMLALRALGINRTLNVRPERVRVAPACINAT
jgi:hypothetical protein